MQAAIEGGNIEVIKAALNLSQHKVSKFDWMYIVNEVTESGNMEVVNCVFSCDSFRAPTNTLWHNGALKGAVKGGNKEVVDYILNLIPKNDIAWYPVLQEAGNVKDNLEIFNRIWELAQDSWREEKIQNMRFIAELIVPRFLDSIVTREDSPPEKFKMAKELLIKFNDIATIEPIKIKEQTYNILKDLINISKTSKNLNALIDSNSKYKE